MRIRTVATRRCSSLIRASTRTRRSQQTGNGSPSLRNARVRPRSSACTRTAQVSSRSPTATRSTIRRRSRPTRSPSCSCPRAAGKLTFGSLTWRPTNCGISRVAPRVSSGRPGRRTANGSPSRRTAIRRRSHAREPPQSACRLSCACILRASTSCIRTPPICGVSVTRGTLPVRRGGLEAGPRSRSMTQPSKTRAERAPFARMRQPRRFYRSTFGRERAQR